MARVLRWPGKMPRPNIKDKPRGGLLGFLASLFSIDQEVKVLDKGLSGEYKVARELANSLGEQWTIINDLKLNLAGRKTQIDHLLFGPPGIFCVETKNWNTAACNDKGEWFRFKGRMWVPQSSPVEQNQAKLEVLAAIFREVDPKVEIQGVVVFPNPGKFDFSNARLPDHTKVFGLPGLIGYLRQLEHKEQTYDKQRLERLISLVFTG